MAKFTVTQSDVGSTLVTFLKEQLPAAWSKKRVKAAIDSHRARVNGAVEKFASYKVRRGDVVTFLDQGPRYKPARDWYLDDDAVLYHDDAIVVFDKPAGVVTNDGTLWYELRMQWPDLEIAHRLDKETTGVWVAARGKEALQELERQFREREVEKSYVAIIDGVPSQDRGTVDLPVEKGGRGGKGEGLPVWQIAKGNKGSPATTDWAVEESGNGISLVRCDPITGRTHQIRLHMKAMGHPILGDYRYVRQFDSEYEAPRCLLHANAITFKHPATGKQVSFESTYPYDIEEAITHLRKG